MEDFARLPEDERRNALRESAAQRDLSEIVIEKDFWVCWTLGRIMSIPEIEEHITFKGGTSLSKAYRLIERFSEDIDLTIAHTAPYLSDIEDPTENDISGKERKRRIDALTIAAQNYVREKALPLLSSAFEESLGTTEGWNLEVDQADDQTLLFGYPSGTDAGSEYIAPIVKLEFGARGEPQPVALAAITPYVAEDFSQMFSASTVEVPTLAAERTFWEKATILHALYHNARLRGRMSRHYYDTVIMTERGVAEEAMKQPGLLEQVVRNKSIMFRDSKASYETAVIGSLKLLPSEEIEKDLRADYADMQEMFMGDAPEFNVLLERLRELEARINTAPPEKNGA